MKDQYSDGESGPPRSNESKESDASGPTSAFGRGIALVDRARDHAGRVAVISGQDAFTYEQLLEASACVASCILDGRDDLRETRVAFQEPPGFEYAAVQWGIWRAGGIAVPLSMDHPAPELEYVIDDAGAGIVIAHADYEERVRCLAQRRGIPFLLGNEALRVNPARLPEVNPARRAMILYTSGTTGRPKGVVTTHNNIRAQIECLIEAWEWNARDRILSVLPLNHVHGIINVLLCAFWAGAACDILPRFDADRVWARIAEGDLTLFMAVPTIYVKLIRAWEKASSAACMAMGEGCSRMRLMVSGSAALPVPVLERWREITGHTLLERYGMTEIGMALSNPLHGPRKPGHVGQPLPGVQVRLLDESGKPVSPGEPGEIQVKGPGVFREYWQRPEATRESFREGWFVTGDIAVVEDGSYRMLGRSNTDIIKTGGYKVSAPEIENVLLEHPEIEECAVVGIDDPEWGQRVGAALVLAKGASLDPDSLRAWTKERLAQYKTPTRILFVDDLPRNAMGKVQKTVVVALFPKGEMTNA